MEENNIGSELHRAIASGDEARVLALLQDGVDIEAQNRFGWTPLMAAACKGKVNLAQLLLDHGADIEARDNDGRTVLMLVVRREFTHDMVRHIVALHADVNAQDKSGCTALMFAALRGRVSDIETLLDGGADINDQDVGGWTALMYASGESPKDSEIGRLGREASTSPDGEKAPEGDPVVKAKYLAKAYRKRAAVVRHLLKSGAEAELRDADGHTALDVALRNTCVVGDDNSEVLAALRGEDATVVADLLELRHKKTGNLIVALDEVSLGQADLIGLNLTGVGLRDRLLFNTNLMRANLTEADLTGSQLPYVNLRGANLRRATLRGTVISQAKLSSTDLSEVDLTHSILFATELHGAKVDGLRLSHSEISVCDFSNKAMAGVYWSGMKFSNMEMVATDLGGSRLRGVIFQRCVLRNARLVGANLEGVVFRDCEMEGLDFTDTTFKSVCFINCTKLHLAVGLETITHKTRHSLYGAPSLDIATARACISQLPNSFVLGFGYSMAEITALRSIYGTDGNVADMSPA